MDPALLCQAWHSTRAIRRKQRECAWHGGCKLAAHAALPQKARLPQKAKP